MKMLLYQDDKDRNMTMSRLLTIFMFILLFSGIANAVSIGVSPGVMRVDNLLRGGYAERNLFITMSSDENVSIALDTSGDVASWIKFKQGNLLQVSKNHPQQINVVIEPPSDTQNGQYDGFIRVRTERLGDTGSGIGTASIASVFVTLNFTVTDFEIKECRVESFNVENTEEGKPAILKAKILNEGNVRLRPRITADLWDQEQEELLKILDFEGEAILPSLIGDLEFEIPTEDLDTGQYWIEVTSEDCNDADLLTFDVYEKGALKSEINLIQILNNVWNNKNEVVPIKAVFENSGQKSVLTNFKGVVSLDDKIIETLESEALEIRPGEKSDVTMFFTPKEPGRYLVTGRMFYDNKRTFEVASVINVVEDSGNKVVYVLIYSAIGLVVVFLLIKIRNARRRLRH